MGVKVPKGVTIKGTKEKEKSSGGNKNSERTSAADLLGTKNNNNNTKNSDDKTTEENEDSTLGVLVRGVKTLLPSIGKGITSAVDDIADSLVSLNYSKDQGNAERSGKYSLMEKAEQSKKLYEQVSSKHVLGDTVANWEKDVDKRQAAIATDNPTSKVAQYTAKGLELGESVGRMLPSVGLSMATGGVTGVAAAGQIAGLGTMALSAYDSSFDKSISEGYDTVQSGKKALGDAMLETGTELLFGGIAGLGKGVVNKATLDTFTKTVAKVGASEAAEQATKKFGVKNTVLALSKMTVKAAEIAETKTVKGLFLRSFGEGAEEMISEALSPFIERATTNPKADYATIEEILEAGVGGALVSFAMAPLGKIETQIDLAKQRKAEEFAAQQEAETAQSREGWKYDDAEEQYRIANDLVFDTVFSAEDVRVAAKKLGRSSENPYGKETPAKDERDTGFFLYSPSSRTAAAEAMREAREKGSTPEAMSTMWGKLNELLERDTKIWQDELASKKFAENYVDVRVGEDNDVALAEQEYAEAEDEIDRLTEFYASMQASKQASLDDKDTSSTEMTMDIGSYILDLEELQEKKIKAAEKVVGAREAAAQRIRAEADEQRLREEYGEEMVSSFQADTRVQLAARGLVIVNGVAMDETQYNNYIGSQAHILKPKTFDELKAEQRTANEELVNTLISELNAKLQERGLGDKLQVRLSEEEDEIESDIDAYYSPSSGGIVFNRESALTPEFVRYNLAHEFLHFTMANLPGGVAPSTIYTPIIEAANHIGYDFRKVYDMLYDLYEDHYNQEDMAEEEMDVFILEETAARFMQTAFGSESILESLALVNSDLVEQMKQIAENSVTGEFSGTLWDYERLVILDRINEAIARPRDPESNQSNIQEDIEDAEDRSSVTTELTNEQRLDIWFYHQYKRTRAFKDLEENQKIVDYYADSFEFIKDPETGEASDIVMNLSPSDEETLDFAYDSIEDLLEENPMLERALRGKKWFSQLRGGEPISVDAYEMMSLAGEQAAITDETSDKRLPSLASHSIFSVPIINGEESTAYKDAMAARYEQLMDKMIEGKKLTSREKKEIDRIDAILSDYWVGPITGGEQSSIPPGLEHEAMATRYEELMDKMIDGEKLTLKEKRELRRINSELSEIGYWAEPIGSRDFDPEYESAASMYEYYMGKMIDGEKLTGKERREMKRLFPIVSKDWASINSNGFDPEYESAASMYEYYTDKIISGEKLTGKEKRKMKRLSSKLANHYAKSATNGEQSTEGQRFLSMPLHNTFGTPVAAMNEERLRQYTELQEKYGTHSKDGLPKQINENVGTSKLADRVYNDKNTPQDFKEQMQSRLLDGAYTHLIITDDNALSRVNAKIKEKNSLGEAYTMAREQLQSSNGHLDKDTIVLGEQMLIEVRDRITEIKERNESLPEDKRLSTDELNRMLEELLSDLAMAGTRAGQNLQAFSLLKKMTPQGRLYYIDSAVTNILEEMYGSRGHGFIIDRSGASLIGGYRFQKDSSGNYLKDKNGKKIEIKVSEDLRQRFLNCKTVEEMDALEEEIIADIASQIPPKLIDRVTAWRYLAMLGNPRTHIRNIASNAVMGSIVKAKNKVGAVLEDIILPGETAGRTKTMMTSLNDEQVSELKDFATNDWKNDGMAEQTLNGGKIGFQTRIFQELKTLGFGDVEFLDKLAKWNSNMMEKEDSWAGTRMYKEAFVNYCKAQGLTAEFLNSGTVEANTRLAQARNYSVHETAKAIYRDTSVIAKCLNDIEKSSSVAKIIVGGLMPFKGTPIAILKRGIEYSPIGLVHGFTQVVKRCHLADDVYQGEYSALNSQDAANLNKADSRMSAHEKHVADIADAINMLSAGLTGTGIMLLGLWLGMLGMVKAGGKDNDKEEYYDEMLGNQEYSVTICGTNYTLDWMTPVSMPFFAGATVAQGFNGGSMSFEDIVNGIVNMVDPVTNLSVLQGINDALSVYDGGLTKFATSATESFAAQFVPTIAGQVARSIDPIRRSTYAPKTGDTNVGKNFNTFVNRMENKIPGLSQNNAAYVDMWGRNEENAGGSFIGRLFANSIAPWYTKEANKTVADDYITALFSATDDNSVIPGTVSKNYTFGSETIPLSSTEYQQTQELVGQLRYLGVTSLMEVNGFADLTADEQASIVEEAYDFAREVAKSDYAYTNGISFEEESKTTRIKNAVAAGLSIGEALYIEHVTSGLGADKDKNGNSIAYSKKKKVLNFYNTMGLTQDQIAALWQYKDYKTSR